MPLPTRRRVLLKLTLSLPVCAGARGTGAKRTRAERGWRDKGASSGGSRALIGVVRRLRVIPAGRGTTTHPAGRGTTTHPAGRGTTTHSAGRGITTHAAERGATTRPAALARDKHDSGAGTGQIDREGTG